MLKTALANLFAAKLATVGAAAAAAVATGGIAVAAATGNLPTQGDHTPKPQPTFALASHSPKPSHSPESSPDADDATEHSAPAGDASPKASPHVNASPNPSLDGLCRAFQAGAIDNPGKADDSAAFQVLISAAGDKDKVGAFCVSRIGTPKPGNDSADNDGHGKPSGTPGRGNEDKHSNEHNGQPTPSASASSDSGGDHGSNGTHDSEHPEGH